MRLLTSYPELLKVPIGVISELIDEGIFDIKKDVFEFVSTDRAMICMVDFKLFSSAFDEYEVEKDYSIGINIETLADILSRVKKKDKIVWEYNNNKIIITLSNLAKRRFEIPTLDLTRESLPDISQLKFNSKVTIESSLFAEAISDIDLVAESVVFLNDDEKFIISGTGDVSSAQLEIKKEDAIEFETTEHSRARYPLDYIKKIAKIKSLADNLTIEFSTDYPCRISTKILDKVYISFIVAPRIE